MGQAIAEGMADWKYGAEHQAKALVDMQKWSRNWELADVGRAMGTCWQEVSKHDPMDDAEWLISRDEQDWQLITEWARYAGLHVALKEYEDVAYDMTDEEWEHQVAKHAANKAQWDEAFKKLTNREG